MTRDEAIKWLSRIEQRYIINGDESYDEARKEALHMAIEALERQQGEWIPHEIQVSWGDRTTDVTMFRCSVCGYEQDWQSKFCSNCGADMRGEKNVD